MSTMISPPPEVREQRVVLNHVSWETYEHLLADHIDVRSPRFTYDQGVLEIMSPSFEHENLNDVLTMVGDMLAEEWGIQFIKAGSTTFRRRDRDRGAEPDSCFYIQNVERVLGKREIDLTADPPPDLVIEIEITRPAVSKLPIYASFGVPEIWVTDGHGVSVLRLAAGEYERSEQSGVLPPLTASVLSDFLKQSKTLEPLVWRKMVRNWARERRYPGIGSAPAPRPKS